MADQPNDPNRVDPENLDKTRERLARAGTSRSPTAQGAGTGVSSGLQPGGTTPRTGAGGKGDAMGNTRTPGGQTGKG